MLKTPQYLATVRHIPPSSVLVLVLFVMYLRLCMSVFALAAPVETTVGSKKPRVPPSTLPPEAGEGMFLQLMSRRWRRRHKRLEVYSQQYLDILLP